MRHGIRCLGAGLTMTATLLLAGGGCDGPPAVESSTTEATVKGTVTIDGTPASAGEIVFDPSNYKRKDVGPRRFPIGKDGTYSAKTLVGDNSVTLSGEPVQKNASLQFEKRPLDVKSGDNTFDFKVETKK